MVKQRAACMAGIIHLDSSSRLLLLNGPNPAVCVICLGFWNRAVACPGVVTAIVALLEFGKMRDSAIRGFHAEVL